MYKYSINNDQKIIKSVFSESQMDYLQTFYNIGETPIYTYIS